MNIFSIHADNGVYAATSFKADCDTKQQKLTFCTVGCHWHNWIAERAIGSLTNTARTLLLHVLAKRPGTITKQFWPFAVRNACTLHNTCPLQLDMLVHFTIPVPDLIQVCRLIKCSRLVSHLGDFKTSMFWGPRFMF